MYRCMGSNYPNEMAVFRYFYPTSEARMLLSKSLPKNSKVFTHIAATFVTFCNFEEDTGDRFEEYPD